MRTLVLLLIGAVIAGTNKRFSSNWFGVLGVLFVVALYWRGRV